MHGVIVTPTWNPSEYHPHSRRIAQLISLVERNNMQPIIVSLSGNIKKDETHKTNILLGKHPLIRNASFTKRQEASDTKLMIERIKEVIVANQGLIENADIVFLTHPMLLSAADAINNKNKLVDFPDAPASETDIEKTGIHSVDEFCRLLRNYKVIVLHEQESIRLQRVNIAAENIHIVRPTIRKDVPALQGIQPSCICLYGRNSPDALPLFFRMYRTLSEDDFSKKHLDIIACGEISKLIPRNLNINIAGPVEKFNRYIVNAICPILCNENPRGISNRVLDAVECGGYPIVDRKAAIGYPFEDYPFLFDNMSEVPEMIAEIYYDPAGASIKINELHERFLKMSEESDAIIDNLLQQIVKGHASV
jgi:hypothetical protein